MCSVYVVIMSAGNGGSTPSREHSSAPSWNLRVAGGDSVVVMASDGGTRAEPRSDHSPQPSRVEARGARRGSSGLCTSPMRVRVPSPRSSPCPRCGTSHSSRGSPGDARFVDFVPIGAFRLAGKEEEEECAAATTATPAVDVVGAEPAAAQGEASCFDRHTTYGRVPSPVPPVVAYGAVKPMNFEMVEPGLYRCGYPTAASYGFLQGLRIATIMYVRHCGCVGVWVYMCVGTCVRGCGCVGGCCARTSSRLPRIQPC